MPAPLTRRPPCGCCPTRRLRSALLLLAALAALPSLSGLRSVPHRERADERDGSAPTGRPEDLFFSIFKLTPAEPLAGPGGAELKAHFAYVLQAPKLFRETLDKVRHCQRLAWTHLSLPSFPPQLPACPQAHPAQEATRIRLPSPLTHSGDPPSLCARQRCAGGRPRGARERAPAEGDGAIADEAPSAALHP